MPFTSACLRAPAAAPRTFATTLAIFVGGAVILRVLASAAWIFFPADNWLGHIGRVIIPLGVTVGLVLLNRWCLSRDGRPTELLGLSRRQGGLFFVGVAWSIPVVLAIAGATFVFVPFHWQRGVLGWSALAWQFFEYAAGNSGEELMFRAYLLLALWARLGLARALLIVAVLFGAFHLPGLSGATALSMVCSTALGSYLFAFAYLLTGSLWTAFGLHVGANFFLHAVFGLGVGKSLLMVQLHAAWPTNPFFPLLVWVVGSLPFIIAAALLWRAKQVSRAG
jgi:uncharacterized protein